VVAELVLAGRVGGQPLRPVALVQLDVPVLAEPRVGERELAGGADDLKLVAAGVVQGNVELGQRVPGQREGRGEPQVTSVGVLGSVDDLRGGHRKGLAAEQPDRADAVAAQIQHRAAAQAAGAADVAGVDADREGRPDEPDLTDPTAGDQSLGEQGLWVVAPHQALDTQPSGRVGGGHGQRLLAQHVLARPQRLDGPLGVQRDRQRHIDRVDLLGGQQLVVGTEAARHAQPGGIRSGLRGVPAGDGDELGPLGVADCLRHDTADPGGGQHAPAHGGHQAPAVPVVPVGMRSFAASGRVGPVLRSSTRSRLLQLLLAAMAAGPERRQSWSSSPSTAGRAGQDHLARPKRYAERMTVRELLAQLQYLPRDLEVLAFEAGCEDYLEREVDELEVQGGRVYLHLGARRDEPPRR
jgi:hypothetical protein